MKTALNKLETQLDNPFFWLISSFAMLLLPLILIGSPGFYGDDLNVLKTIDERGVVGSLSLYMKTYGFLYRPIGASFLYAYYGILGHNDFLSYASYLLLYLAFVYVLYDQMFKLTKNAGFSVFVAIFVLFFPFNATVFWQIPSGMMVLAFLLSIIMIKLLLNNCVSISKLRLGLWSIGWLCLLFMYEQLAGLVVVMLLCCYFIKKSSAKNMIHKNGLLVYVSLFLVTSFFLMTYFMSSVNPKVVSLKTINANFEKNHTVEVEETINNANKEVVVYNERLDVLTRVSSLNNRIKAGLIYTYKSIFYGVKELYKRGVKGKFILLVTLMFALLTLVVRINLIPKVHGYILLLVGFVWVAVTIAPFLLYKAVHIPPYTLMLPSIGIAMSVYAAISIIFSDSKNIFSKYSVKILLFVSAFTFPIAQYSYYFGLQEELRYWEKIAEDVIEYKDELNKGSIIVINNAKFKNNGHIFWLEKATGKRYFSTLLNLPVANVKIDKDFDNKRLSVFLPIEKGMSRDLIILN